MIGILILFHEVIIEYQTVVTQTDRPQTGGPPVSQSAAAHANLAASIALSTESSREAAARADHKLVIKLRMKSPVTPGAVSLYEQANCTCVSDSV